MSTPPDAGTRSATYQDVRGAPQHTLAELVDGGLPPMPHPAIARAAAALHVDIGPAFGAPARRGGGPPGGWHISIEAEVHLGDAILLPDLAGSGRERMAGKPRTAFIPQPPDWVCEVVSPWTARLARARTLPVHAREGAVNVRIEPFEAVECSLSRWWGQG